MPVVRSLILACGVLSGFASAALAADTCPLGDGPPYGPAYGAWSRGEQLAWEAIRRGEAINLLEPQPDPRSARTDPGAQQLGPWFLQTLFGVAACERAIGALGVYIIGGDFPLPVYVNGIDTRARLVITGARFKGGLSIAESHFGQSVHLVYGTFGGTLEIKRSRVDGELDLQRNALAALDLYSLDVDRSLDLSRTRPPDAGERAALAALRPWYAGAPVLADPPPAAEPTKLINLHVGQHLHLVDGRFAGIALYGSRIAGDLEGDGAQFTAPAYLPGLEVGGAVRLRGARSELLQLEHANIAGALDLGELAGPRADATRLCLGGARVDDTLRLWQARLDTLDLRGVRVGNSLLVEQVEVAGNVRLDEAEVGHRLALRVSVSERGPRTGEAGPQASCMPSAPRESKPEQTAGPEQNRVSGRGLKAGEVVLQGACWPSVDLTAAAIGGTLDLAGTRWRDGATLDLTNAAVQRFSDEGAATAAAGGSADCPQAATPGWPARLGLNGFSYAQLGAAAQRDGGDWAAWVGRQAHFSRLPYQQLADRLRAAGRGDAASEVLYAMRVRELDARPPSLGWAWGWVERVLTGFGYRKERAIVPIVVLIVLGTAFAARRWARSALPEPWTLARRCKYSVQALIPMIDTLFPKLSGLLPLPRIDEQQYREIDSGWRVGGPAWCYFHLHRFLGLLLAVALIVSLTGLTA